MTSILSLFTDLVLDTPLYKSEISLPDGKMKKQSENKFWEEKDKTTLAYQKSYSENNFLSSFLKYDKL